MEELIDLEQLRDIIEIEGLEYAVTAYMSGEDIEDDDIREAWINASEAFDKLRALLREKGIEEE